MRRAPLLIALLAGLLAVPPAGAAPKPQLTDARGDYPVAGADLVSGLFATTKGKLVITLEFAGPVNTPVPFGYQVSFSTDDSCTWRGNFFGATGSSSGGCTTSEASPPTVKVAGNKIIFTIAAKGALAPGTELSKIAASSTPSGALAGGPGGDTGQTDATYVVGK